MKTLDAILLEFAKEITDFYTIVVKEGNKVKRFSFETKRLNNLEKELSKNFGGNVVKGIMKELNLAIAGNYLKNFAVDDSVDFSVDGDKLTTLIRQSDRIAKKLAENNQVVEDAEFNGKTWVV